MRFRVNFKKYEKTPADISASHTLEVTFKLFENKILTDSKHSKILSCMNPLDNVMVKKEQKKKTLFIKCIENSSTPKWNTTQALRHEHDPLGEVGLEENGMIMQKHREKQKNTEMLKKHRRCAMSTTLPGRLVSRRMG